MSPVVLGDGVIHHPTRLSVGPAWLTAAIYLNVIGSKLARGRAVRKGAGGGVSLGISQRPVHTQPQPWRGAGLSREVVLSVVLNHTGLFLFLPGDSAGRRGGVFGTQRYPGFRWELRAAAVMKHCQGQKVTVIYLHGYGHEIWSHNPSVFTHLKDI